MGQSGKALKGKKKKKSSSASKLKKKLELDAARLYEWKKRTDVESNYLQYNTDNAVTISEEDYNGDLDKLVFYGKTLESNVIDLGSSKIPKEKLSAKASVALA